MASKITKRTLHREDEHRRAASRRSGDAIPQGGELLRGVGHRIEDDILDGLLHCAELEFWQLAIPNQSTREVSAAPHPSMVQRWLCLCFLVPRHAPFATNTLRKEVIPWLDSSKCGSMTLLIYSFEGQ